MKDKSIPQQYLDGLLLEVYEKKDMRTAKVIYDIAFYYTDLKDLYANKPYLMSALIEKGVEPKEARKFIDGYYKDMRTIYDEYQREYERRTEK